MFSIYTNPLKAMLINYDVWVGMGCIIYQLFC